MNTRKKTPKAIYEQINRIVGYLTRKTWKNGTPSDEVINAVYTAALNLNTVDKDSFSDFTKDGFYFTVDGMYCAYNYRLRNELNTTLPYNRSIISPLAKLANLFL